MSIFKKQKTRATKKIRSILDSSTGLVPSVTAGRRAMRQLAGKDREIAALRRELAKERGASEIPSTNAPVFFVVGNQKSGTTWLMKMLDAHPEILCQGEGRPFGRGFNREDQKQRPGGYPPATLYNAITGSGDLRLWIERSVWTKRDDPDEHLDNLMKLSIEYFLNQRLARTTKKIVGDKTVLLETGIVEEIGRVIPEAKVIHIIRDGRDVAISTMHHIWNQAADRGGHGTITPDQRSRRDAYDEDPRKLIESGEGIFPAGWLEKYASRWKVRVSRAGEDGATLPNGHYAEVLYEDLLTNPEPEMKRLFEFLGAESDDKTVNRSVSAASFENLSEGRKPGEEAASFYRKGIAGDWKNAFTEKNKADFKEKAGDLLVKLGYESDYDW